MKKRKAKAKRSVTGKQMLVEAGGHIYRIMAIARRDPAKILRAAEKCTTSNCGWGTYDAAKLILFNRELIESTPASTRRGT